MAASRKKKIIQQAQERRRRGRIYLAVIVIAVIVVGVGLYVYVSSLSSPEYAKLDTSQGTITIQLYPNSAPKTVANFISLANSHFYDHLVWWRIAKNFVIQTGDPNSRYGLNNSTWGSGGSAQIPFEYDSSLHNTVGYVAMASTAPKVGGSSQFYINLKDNSGPLDGNYTVFGKVISGMDVAFAIGNLPIYTPPDGQPINPSDAMLNSVVISSSP